MRYDFDEIIPRKGTDCLKFDNVAEVFGTEDVIPMWIADMDFRTPPFIMETLRNRLKHEILGYTFCSHRWKPAIQRWVSRRYGWQVSEEEIGFVGGIVPALSFAVQCFTEEGDKILIQPPVYHPYSNVVNDLKRSLVSNPLKIENGRFEIDFDDFERKVSGCKMFLLCNPHNPGGRVWRKEELVRIADVCARNGVIVVSDEIHCDMTLDGNEHTVFAGVSEAAADNSITLMAASKTFNIAGLKSSYHIIKNNVLRERYKEFLRVRELDCAHLFATEAVAVAYENGEEWLAQMLDYVSGNLNFVEKFINDNLPGMGVIRPQASYLVFLDARGLKMSQTELVEFFVKEAKVGMNDGAMFGVEGTGFMRMNVGCPRAILEKAFMQIKEAYDRLELKNRL